MAIEYWCMLNYIVGTATGWYMFRASRGEREELIKQSCDQFLHLLIAGDCVRVRYTDEGEIEVMTIAEALAESESSKEPETA